MNIFRVSSDVTPDEEIGAPQLTSDDPNERKLARRLRIKKRLYLEKKKQRHQSADYDGTEEFEEKSPLEMQIEASEGVLEKLLDEGREFTTMVRVSSDAREVERRKETTASRIERIEKLEEESAKALEEFEEIISKWKIIAVTKEPVDIHKGLMEQTTKCRELIKGMNVVIERLKKELEVENEKFSRHQTKHEEEVAELSDRINNHVRTMRRAYKQELKLIEEIVSNERKQLLELNKKKWELLFNQREREEIVNMERKFQLVQEFEQDIDNTSLEHLELFREMKIKLETDLQSIQLDLEQVKAACLLNSEKLYSNYQLLKRRDDENLIVRTQQKRRLNKLTDAFNKLRKEIAQVDRTTASEKVRLTAEILKLHQSIINIGKKADRFADANDKVYKQVWQLKTKEANDLIQELVRAEKIIWEQQLCLEWSAAGMLLPKMTDLDSYKAAERALEDQRRHTEERRQTSDELPRDSASQSKVGGFDDFLKRILYKVTECAGFLIDESMKGFLFPYRKEEKLLIKIDTIFSSLGISKEEDIMILKEYFVPYAICSRCLKVPPDLMEITKIPTLFTWSEIIQSKSTESDATSSKMSSATTDQTAFSGDKSEEGGSYGSEVSRHTCSDFPLTIDPIYAVKALREFVSNFSSKEEEEVVNISTRLAKKRHTFSRMVYDEELEDYWRKFEDAFPPSKENLWTAIFLVLSRYQNLLEERHKLNVECQNLEKQNGEIKRLLEGYMSSLEIQEVVKEAVECTVPVVNHKHKAVNTGKETEGERETSSSKVS